uniref:Uncharacterized protein n=1 Tax=Noctiluca scintillans TaxID=2966 RepID=A0A7S0ZWS2_NOCSC|mmetsp:Transcript_22150/g.58718  ORF Transcript_22150/g.58718 Transcript_22150/m.58718 type:complete len:340 (+) Transcript_22150:153-1172(+)
MSVVRAAISVWLFWAGVHCASLRRQPKPPSFFTDDPQKMILLPNYRGGLLHRRCHPTCTWDCGHRCNTLCAPTCRPPQCVTTCQHIFMTSCEHMCGDPHCTVVCPPQCEHGRCPDCRTVCATPVCALHCGGAHCQTRCAEPQCDYTCHADPSCQPECKLRCDHGSEDTTSCLNDVSTEPCMNRTADQLLAARGLSLIHSEKDVNHAETPDAVVSETEPVEADYTNVASSSMALVESRSTRSASSDNPSTLVVDELPTDADANLLGYDVAWKGAGEGLNWPSSAPGPAPAPAPGPVPGPAPGSAPMSAPGASPGSAPGAAPGAAPGLPAPAPAPAAANVT